MSAHSTSSSAGWPQVIAGSGVAGRDGRAPGPMVARPAPRGGPGGRGRPRGAGCRGPRRRPGGRPRPRSRRVGPPGARAPRRRPAVSAARPGAQRRAHAFGPVGRLHGRHTLGEDRADGVGRRAPRRRRGARSRRRRARAARGAPAARRPARRAPWGRPCGAPRPRRAADRRLSVDHRVRVHVGHLVQRELESPNGESDALDRRGELADGCSPSGSVRPSRVDAARAGWPRFATSILLFRSRLLRAADYRGSDVHPAGRLAARPGRRDARRALRLRPDLTVPPPADLTVLATRAGVRASVHRACDDLDTSPCTSWRRSSSPTRTTRRSPPAEVARLLGPTCLRAALDTALAALRARALAWDAVDPDTSGAEWAGIALVPAVRDVVSRFPGGLGRPGGGGRRVVGAAAAARRASTPTSGACSRRWPPGRRSGAAARRTRRAPSPGCWPGGCCVRVDAGDRRAAPPGRARAARRPAAGRARPRPAGPRTTATAASSTVDGTAAGAALRALRQVEQLVAFWGDHAARRCCAPAASVCASCAGRPARSTPTRPRPRCSSRSRWRRTSWARATASRPSGCRRPQADVWAAGGPEQQWAALARAWLDLPRAAGARRRPGRRRAADRRAVRRPAPPDGPPRPAPRARRPRRAAAGNGRGGPPTRWPACWRGGRPGAAGGCATRSCSWTLAEATVLGVVALDALSTPGRTLLADPARAAAALRAALPDPVDHVLLQADLTAVAPGPLEAELERELDLVARGRVGGRGDRLPVHRGHGPPCAGRRAHRRGAARPVRDPLGHAGAAGPDLPRRRRRPPARAAARRRGGLVPALRRRGADRRGARLTPTRRVAGAAPDRADRAVSPLAARRADGRAARRPGSARLPRTHGGAVLDLTDRGRRTAPRRRSGRATRRRNRTRSSCAAS